MYAKLHLMSVFVQIHRVSGANSLLQKRQMEFGILGLWESQITWEKTVLAKKSGVCGPTISVH